MTREFRNVEFDQRLPVAFWPGEAIEAMIDCGDVLDWATLTAEIRRQPRGHITRFIETLLGQPNDDVIRYGVERLLRRVIAAAQEPSTPLSSSSTDQ